MEKTRPPIRTPRGPLGRAGGRGLTARLSLLTEHERKRRARGHGCDTAAHRNQQTRKTLAATVGAEAGKNLHTTAAVAAVAALAVMTEPTVSVVVCTTYKRPAQSTCAAIVVVDQTQRERERARASEPSVLRSKTKQPPPASGKGVRSPGTTPRHGRKAAAGGRKGGTLLTRAAALSRPRRCAGGGW